MSIHYTTHSQESSWRDSTPEYDTSHPHTTWLEKFSGGSLTNTKVNYQGFIQGGGGGGGGGHKQDLRDVKL